MKICQKAVDVFVDDLDHLPFLVILNKSKNKRMGNCLLKFNDKPFILHTPPLTAGHLKKVASGIRKNSVKYFASGMQ